MPVIRFTVTVLFLGNNESGFGEVGGNMDYQHSFKKKGELLTFSYRFSHSPNNSEANTDYEDTLNVPYLLQKPNIFKNDASTQRAYGSIGLYQSDKFDTQH